MTEREEAVRALAQRIAWAYYAGVLESGQEKYPDPEHDLEGEWPYFLRAGEEAMRYAEALAMAERRQWEALFYDADRPTKPDMDPPPYAAALEAIR